METSLKEQKELNEACQNYYECQSNQCIDGECVSLKKETEEIKSLLQQIITWLKQILGIE